MRIANTLFIRRLRRMGKNLDNQQWNKNFHLLVEKYFGIEVEIGSYGYMDLPAGTKIGNYCSIASGVRYLAGNHPLEHVSTAACFFNPALGLVDKKYDIKREKLTVGNDVWIGANVLITNKCKKIGNGAVIGGGTVVTHDIAPYSIVVGNSGREIRKRFSDEVMESLEKCRWWELPVDELLKFLDLMNQPLKFAEEIKIYRGI